MFRLITSTLVVSMAIATVASADVPVAVGQETAPEDKLVCKRYVETGSLAKMVKECHTAANWQKLAIAGREDARYMVLKGINSFGNRQ